MYTHNRRDMTLYSQLRRKGRPQPLQQVARLDVQRATSEAKEIQNKNKITINKNLEYLLVRTFYTQQSYNKLQKCPPKMGRNVGKSGKSVLVCLSESLCTLAHVASRSLDFQKRLRVFTVGSTTYFYGFLWISMEFYGFLWML